MAPLSRCMESRRTPASRHVYPSSPVEQPTYHAGVAPYAGDEKRCLMVLRGLVVDQLTTNGRKCQEMLDFANIVRLHGQQKRIHRRSRKSPAMSINVHVRQLAREIVLIIAICDYKLAVCRLLCLVTWSSNSCAVVVSCSRACMYRTIIKHLKGVPNTYSSC